MSALSWTDLANIVLDNFGAVIYDTVVKTGFGNDGNILTSPSERLRARGRVFIGGADGVDRKPREWAIHYGGASAASFGVNDAYPAATQESYLDANLDWKRVGVSMAYDNLVRLTQKGSNRGGVNAIAEDLEHKLKELMDEMDEELVTDGTGNSSKDLTGMLAFLSTSNTYAGLAQGSYSWWQAVLSNAAAAALNKEHLRAVVRTLADRQAFRFGKMETWMGLGQYHNYLELYEDNLRYAPGQQISDAANPLIYADGMIALPIFAVAGVPSTEIWIVNPDLMEFRFVDHNPDDSLANSDETIYHEGVPVGIEPVYQNKDIKSFFLKAYGQLVCMDPYRQARIYGLAT